MSYPTKHQPSIGSLLWEKDSSELMSLEVGQELVTHTGCQYIDTKEMLQNSELFSCQNTGKYLGLSQTVLFPTSIL